MGSIVAGIGGEVDIPLVAPAMENKKKGVCRSLDWVVPTGTVEVGSVVKLAFTEKETGSTGSRRINSGFG
jgi:hypothetical protein